MTGRRMVVIDIESICNLLKDYCGQVGFPEDGKAVKLMMNNAERKLAIMVESDTWGINQTPEEIRFDLQRVHSLGGVS